MRWDDFIPTRESLLSRLKDWEDDESWREFFHTYWRLIYSVALKAGLTPAEAEDVVQTTSVTVAKNIHQFKKSRQRGSFKGWLLKSTRWRIADQFRKRSPAVSEGADTVIDQIADPSAEVLDLLWDQEWDSNLLETATEQIRRRVDPEQYQLFFLHVVQGRPAAQVAERFGVPVQKVYGAKYKVTELVATQIEKLRKEWS